MWYRARVKFRFYHSAARRINGHAPQAWSLQLRERDGSRHDERIGIGRRRRGPAHNGDVVGRNAYVTVGSVGSHPVVIGLAHDGVAVDERERVLDLEPPFVVHLDLANLFGRLTFLRARE